MKPMKTLVAILAGQLLAAAAHGAVTLTTLHSFTGTDGAYPRGALVRGADGNIYGTTSEDFGTNYGTVFRVTPDGTFTNLYRFSGTNDGAWPQSGLVPGSDGNFYGTAHRGPKGWGTIFKISPSGSFSNFAAMNSHSGLPACLLAGTEGDFYSIGTSGFDGGLGSIFRVTPDGSVTLLALFAGTNGFAGWLFSTSILIQGNGEDLYGATPFGGSGFVDEYTYPVYGTVFAVSPYGAIQILFSFNGTNGAHPSALILGRDGNLYGTTGTGGPGFVDSSGGGGDGHGTVFKLSTNGDFTTLAFFDGTNGNQPSSLMQASDGNFYGTTAGVTANLSTGSVFKVTADGTLTSLLSFNGTNGAAPVSTLLEAPDGNFYGTTYSGGTSNRGTIFRLTTTSGPLSIQSIMRADNTVAFTWRALAGHLYQAQFTTSLIQTNWTDLAAPITATNTTATASDIIGADRQRFYRVVLSP